MSWIVHLTGLARISVCVHTTVHGTCHVLSIHLSFMCSLIPSECISQYM